MTRRFAVGGGLAALLASPCLGQVGEQDQSQADGREFERGTLVIYRKSSGSGAPSFLERVTIEKLADKFFVVGTTFASGDSALDSFAGTECWIALDDVSLVRRFRNRDSATKLFKKNRVKD